MSQESAKEKISVRLLPPMIAKAERVLAVVAPDTVNIEFIKEYEALIPADGLLDVFSLEKLGGQFLLARDMCIDAANVADAVAAEAKRQLEREEAVAFLDRSTEHFTKQQIKPTDKLRESFVANDEEYNKKMQLHISWKALAKFFEQKVASFELWHNWTKKLYDKDNSKLGDATRDRVAPNG